MIYGWGRNNDKGKGIIKSFKCGKLAYVAADWCQRMINVAKNKSLNNNDDDGEADYGGGGRSGGGGPVFDEENAGDNEDVIYGDGELSLIIGKTLPTPRVPIKDEISKLPPYY